VSGTVFFRPHSHSYGKNGAWHPDSWIELRYVVIGIDKSFG